MQFKGDQEETDFKAYPVPSAYLNRYLNRQYIFLNCRWSRLRLLSIFAQICNNNNQ